MTAAGKRHTGKPNNLLQHDSILIIVNGGKPASSDAYEAVSPHGYLGKEPETVEAMVNWILKKPYRSNID